MRFGGMNLFNLIIIAMILLPDIAYAVTNKNVMNKCANRLMNVLEQIGRYGCCLFMVLPIGIEDFGFRSLLLFLVYLLGVPILMVVYLTLWEIEFGERANTMIAFCAIVGLVLLPCGIVFRWEMAGPIAIILLLAAAAPTLLRNIMPESSRGTKIALSIVPVIFFLLCGVTLMYPLLIVSAIVFGISHPYVTWQNIK